MAVVLACGGRHYQDKDLVFSTLDDLHALLPITKLVHGAATGADALAQDWAKARGIPETGRQYEAQWKDIDVPGAVIRKHRDGSKYNVLAGYMRNQLMLYAEKPDLGVVFPGGNGTDDMMDRLRVAEVPITEVKEDGTIIHWG